MASSRTPAQTRAQFLQRLYELSGANPNTTVDVKGVVGPMGVSEKEIDACLQYALKEGWITPNFTWGRNHGYSISMTPYGIRRAEKAHRKWGWRQHTIVPSVSTDLYPAAPAPPKKSAGKSVLGFGWTRRGAQPGEVISLSDETLSNPWAVFTPPAQCNILALGDNRHELFDLMIPAFLSSTLSRSGALLFASSDEEYASMTRAVEAARRSDDLVQIGTGSENLNPFSWVSPTEGASALTATPMAQSSHPDSTAFWNMAATRYLTFLLYMATTRNADPIATLPYWAGGAEPGRMSPSSVPAQPSTPAHEWIEQQVRELYRLSQMPGISSDDAAAHIHAASLTVDLLHAPADTYISIVAYARSYAEQMKPLHGAPTARSGATIVLDGRILLVDGRGMSAQMRNCLFSILETQLTSILRNTTIQRPIVVVAPTVTTQTMQHLVAWTAGGSGPTARMVSCLIGARAPEDLIPGSLSLQEQRACYHGYAVTGIPTLLRARAVLDLLAPTVMSPWCDPQDLLAMGKGKAFIVGLTPGSPERIITLA